MRGEDGKLCALVVIGADEHGQKKFLAVEDGMRESAESRRDVLRDLKRRGMNAPKVAAGGGALGFWKALDETCPDTEHQRCRVHKTANVLNRLPKRVQPRAKSALQRIRMSETRDDAHIAFDEFVEDCRDKQPKAAEILARDRDELTAFCDYPAAHWQSLRTTNPIESTFATIRHRTRQSKGCLTRRSALCMIFKLGQCAEARWNRLRGFNKLGKVIEGVRFKDGIEAGESTDQVAA